MKLFTALENEAVAEPTAGYRQRIQSLEEQLSSHEVVKAYDEVQADKDISDNAEADVGTLTKVNDILVEATESNKVLTKDVLQMSKVITESICARLGYKKANSLFIATEDAGPTSISLESFSEFINRTWEAIIKFFKRIVEGIKTLWGKLFSRTKITKIKNEQNSRLIKELKHVPQEKSKTLKTIDLKNLSDHYRLTGYIEKNTDPESNKDQIFNAILNTVESATNFMSTLEEDISDLFKQLDKISQLNDIESIEHLVDLKTQEHIFMRGPYFKRINCRLSTDSVNKQIKPGTSWRIYTRAEFNTPSELNNNYICNIQNIEELDILNKDLKKLDDILLSFFNISSEMRNKLNKITSDLNKELDKYQGEDDIIRHKLIATSKITKILEVYIVTIPHLCSDIATNAGVYVTKNLQELKTNNTN